LPKKEKNPLRKRQRASGPRLRNWGCGESVKESSGLFEIDDAKRKIDFAYRQSD